MRSLLFLSLFLTAEAAVLPNLPAITARALPPGCDAVYEEIEMVELNDGPTTSGKAGIGAEFETLGIQFSHDTCSLADTFAAKRKTIHGRSGTNFLLSADTSVEQGKGKLSAEYVLDGTKIEVGNNGMAAAAGKAAYNDLVGWKPWSENPANQITIDDYTQCNPWTVRNLGQNTDKDNMVWIPQVTTSMPLEAIYDLMKENVQLGDSQNGRNILNGWVPTSRGQNIQLVTKDYFQGLSLDLTNLNDAVLGFCSLVLSYAKAANIKLNEDDPSDQEKSPKSWIPFMPRTEFVTIYGVVKSFFGTSVDDTALYNAFNTLACYKTTYNAQTKAFVASIDGAYCTGTVQKPITGDLFGKLQYKYFGQYPKQGVPTTMPIKDWIQGMEKGSPSPDLLTTFDTQFDGSIGGLKLKTEKMFNLDHTAPLFEFRDLNPQYTKDFEKFMGNVDSAVQALHKQFATAPKMKRRVRRDATSCPMPTSAPTTTTNAPKPSCVVQDMDPGLGITSQGCICQGSSTWKALSTSSGATQGAQCSYTAFPSSGSAQATITQAPMKPQTNSQACMVCTPQPNFEDECTSMPNCKPQTAYATATVNSSPVHYGTLSQDALFTDISTAMASACASMTTGTTTVSGKATPTVACNKDKDFTINNKVPYTDAGVLAEDGTLSINVGSYGANADQLKALLAVAASMVTKSANSSDKSCHTMSYEEPLVKRSIPLFGRDLTLPTLWTRDHPVPTFSSMRVCNGPAVVVASYWAPGYRDRIGSGNSNPSPDAQITATLKFTKGADGDFFCEIVAGLAGAILTEAAPELAELDIMEAEQIEAACDEMNQ